MLSMMSCPLRRQEQVAFLGLAQLFEGEHVDRSKIIEPLPQIVGVAAGGFEDEFLILLDGSTSSASEMFSSCWQFSAVFLSCVTASAWRISISARSFRASPPGG